MTKNLLSFSALLLLSATASAQITLNQSSFTSTYTVYDTTKVVSGTSGLPATIARGASQIWDFSGVTYSGSDSVMYMPAPAGYTNMLFKTDTISSPFLFMPSRGYYTLGTGGYVKNVFVMDRRAYSLAGKVAGAGASDSLIFDNQLDTLSSVQNIIKFPATAGSTWSSAYTTKVNFTLKAPGMAIPSAPGYNIRYENETDSVVGWGQMIIKRADNVTALPVDVLMVKAVHNRVDSFYLNGSLAPAALMQAPFLQQGLVQNSYQYRFYRANELTPLVEVTYADAGFTTISKTRIHAQRTTPSAINTIAMDKVKIYPNPVTQHVLNMTLPAVSTLWQYTMVNATGKQVANGTISNQTEVQLSIPNVAPGSYFIVLNNQDLSTVVPVQIAQ